MANARPVPMIDFTTGEDGEPFIPSSAGLLNENREPEPTEKYPNEIIVFKIKETPPEGSQVRATCTKGNCSCDQTTVAEQIKSFCNGLYMLAESRSRMCANTVAEALVGELNTGIYCTYWETPSSENPNNDQEPHGSISPDSDTDSQSGNNFIPGFSLVSPPSSRNPSGDASSSSLEASETDTRIQANLFLSNSIYELLDNDESGTEENENELRPTARENEASEPFNSVPAEATTAIANITETENSEMTAPNSGHVASILSTTEKEVPELEGDAGIFSSVHLSGKTLSTNKPIFSASIANNSTSRTAASPSSINSSESDIFIIDEDSPISNKNVPVTARQTNGNDKLVTQPTGLERSRSTEVPCSTGGPTVSSSSVAKNPANITGLPVCSASQEKAKASQEKAQAEKTSRTRINEPQLENGDPAKRGNHHDSTTSKKMSESEQPLTSESKTEKGSRKRPAPASVKVQRAAKQVAAQMIAKQMEQASGSEAGSPLKRMQDTQVHGEEAESVSSSPGIGLSKSKKKRALPLESEDEYDITPTGNTAMEIEIDPQNGSRTRNSDSVTTEEVQEPESDRRSSGIVNYASSTESMDSMPLNQRRSLLKKRKSRSDKTATGTELLNDAATINISSNMNNAVGNDLDIEIVSTVSNAEISTEKPHNEPEHMRLPRQLNPENHLRKAVSTPVEPVSTSDTSQFPDPLRASFVRSTSLPSSTGTCKLSDPGAATTEAESRRQLAEERNNIDVSAQAHSNPRIQDDQGSVTSDPPAPKPRPPAPPPPVISKSSSDIRHRKSRFDEERTTNRGNIYKSSAQHTASSRSSQSHVSSRDRDRSRTPPPNNSSYSGTGSTSSTEKNTSPVRPSIRPRLDEQSNFDPRSQAIKIKQKPVPKVTKDVAETLLQRQPNPFPSTSSASKKNTKNEGESSGKKESDQQKRGHLFNHSLSLNHTSSQQSFSSQSKQPTRTYLLPTPTHPKITPGRPSYDESSGDIRMAPKPPANVPKSGLFATICNDINLDMQRKEDSAARNRQVGDRPNSDIVRNSSTDEIPKEYSHDGNFDRSNRSARGTEVTSGRSTENLEEIISPQINKNAYESPRSPPRDPRLRNGIRQIIEPVAQQQSSRDRPSRFTSSPRRDDDNRTTPSSSGSWQRGDGPVFTDGRFIRDGMDGRPRSRSPGSYSPTRSRSPQLDMHYSSDTEPMSPEDDRERSGEHDRRDRRERSNSGERRGRDDGRWRDHRQIPTHSGYDSYSQRGRGGKRRPNRGGYRGRGGGGRGGHHHHQDHRHPQYHHNNQSRGSGDGGRPFRFPNQQRNFKGYKNHNPSRYNNP